jgi:hypothetical protein
MIVGLQFYPNQKNPARASGRGVYRVVACSPHDLLGTDILVSMPARHLWMNSTRAFKPGSRVDPLKIALDAARKRA